jgi:hypothetical protein
MLGRNFQFSGSKLSETSEYPSYVNRSISAGRSVAAERQIAAQLVVELTYPEGAAFQLHRWNHDQKESGNNSEKDLVSPSKC